MQQYLQLLQDIGKHGEAKADRTGTGTIILFGKMVKYDLQQGFPIVTTKKLHLRAIVHELLWFLKGDTNIQYLRDNDVHIYTNHVDQVKAQIRRMPYVLPKLKPLPEVESIFDFTFEDIELIGYKHHPAIKAPVAV